MKKTICDRCGSEINDVGIFDHDEIYTHYDISVTTRSTFQHPCVSNGQRVIDLCPSCEKEFSDWLSNKED